MKIQIRIQSFSTGFLAMLTDLDSESETVIEAQTLTDLFELAQRAIEAYQRQKDEKCKAVSLTDYTGQWKWNETP